MNKNLIEILVCPSCKGKLIWHPKQQELLCKFDRLAYPVRDNIPVMLVDEARQVALEEFD